jgi:uncharacterized protein
MELATRGHVEDLPRDICLDLLRSASVGRLGVTVRALPAILPVNYVVFGDDIIVRTVPGSKLDAATAQAVVAFEVDDFDKDGSWGWSVLVQGVAHEVTDRTEQAALRSLRIRPWAYPDGEAYRFLRISTELISGRRFHASSSFRSSAI